MSRSLNKVILIGNLGADPEVRSTSNGSRVATLSVATSRQWKNQSGEKQEKTEWHRVVLWNNKGSTLADIAEKYCKKGDKVYIEGSIEYRSWQDREGQTRYTTEITARELIMLSGRSDGSESSYSAPSKVAAGRQRSRCGCRRDLGGLVGFSSRGSGPCPRPVLGSHPPVHRPGPPDISRPPAIRQSRLASLTPWSCRANIDGVLT